jgi:hypothetical protein
MIGQLFSVVLDCPDPRALAQFYSQLLGLPITREEEGWAQIGDTHSSRLSFQRVPRYQPPRRPDPAFPAQVHLDLQVSDITEPRPGCWRWVPRAFLAPSQASASTPTQPGTSSASDGKPLVDRKSDKPLPEVGGYDLQAGMWRHSQPAARSAPGAGRRARSSPHPGAYRAAGEHDPPPPAYERATIDYFKSMLGADLGIAAYVRS